MKHTISEPPTSSALLHRRLEALTLGLGAAAAITSLPGRADAGLVIFVPHVEGIQTNSDVVFVSGSPRYINLALTPFNESRPIWVQSATVRSYGWNLGFYSTSGGPAPYNVLFGYGAANPDGDQYEFLNIGAFGSSLGIALTGIDDYFWKDQFTLYPESAGETYFVGLRRSGEGVRWYGWAQIQTGSITHLQSAFNFTPGGAIGLGQGGAVPEPSRAVLLASGLAGLGLARRRRSGAD